MSVRTAKRWLWVAMLASGVFSLNALMIGETVWALLFAFFLWSGLVIYRVVLGEERDG
jgi:hypothetical protein